jgi:hypothetical protein
VRWYNIMERYTYVPRYGILEVEQAVPVAQYLSVYKGTRMGVLPEGHLRTRDSREAMAPSVWH